MIAYPSFHKRFALAGCLAICLLLIAGGYSQVTDPFPILTFEHYSLDQGLSQSIVFAIHKDRRGFMWFGTESGLNRFDGYQFTIFKNLPFDSSSISNNNIRAICEDDSGFLWIATTGGLNRYDWRTEKFTRFRNNPKDSLSLSHDIVFGLFIDPARSLWLLTANGGLDRYDPVHHCFIHYRHDSGKKHGLNHNTILTVHRSQQDDRLWVGTPQGLQYYDRKLDDFVSYQPKVGEACWTTVQNIYEARTEPGKLLISSTIPVPGTSGSGLYQLDLANGNVTHFNHHPDDPASLPTNNIFGVYEDNAGTLWLLSDRGLLRLDRQSGRCRQFLLDPKHPTALTNCVRAIYENRRGWLMIVTYAFDGLWIFDRGSERFAQYQHDEADPGSLSNNEIISIYEDSTGVLWLGNNTAGLNKLEYFAHKFNRYGAEPGNDNSLGYPLVRAICQDHDGFLWVGCSRAGLHRYDKSRQNVRHYRFQADDPTSLSNDNIWALCEDHEGVLWVGTYGGGLNRSDQRRTFFERFLFNPTDSATLSDNRIRVIFEDSQNRLWIGTEFGGLNRFDRKQRAFVRIANTADNQGNGSIRAIAEDQAGWLWLGTFGNGLIRWNPETDERTIYTNNPHDSTTLSSNYIQAIYIDRAEVLWIGTFGGGLNRFDPRQGRFTHFNELNSELPDNVIYSIQVDDNGKLWCSSNRGLSCYDPRKKSFQNYDVYHGLQSKEFNGQAGSRGRNGELFFGGINGFNAFFPDQVMNNPYPPRIMLTGLKLFGESIPISENSILKRHISAMERIELAHNQNDLTFDFVALHYNRPQENGYAYLLENYDKKWRMSGTQRSATYTNLNPGTYRFHVIGRNSDGVWNKKGASISLIIHPPWWKTTLAYLLFALLSVTGVLAFYRFQHSRVVKREQDKAQIANAELRAQAAEAQSRAIQAENERQSHELEEARRLQLSMLPKRLPEVPGLDIAVYMETATEVGGDFYDFRLTPDGLLTVAIGDATGHGLKAGTMVSVLKGLFLAYGANGQVGEFFEICTQTIRRMHLGNLYMALALAKINGSEVSISSAGMPPFYLFHQTTGKAEEITLKGMPLGAFADYPYQRTEKTLQEGDSLLLLSDGLAEVFNDQNEIFDYPRVKTTFEKIGHLPAEEIIRQLQMVAKEWRNGRELHDDITFVVLKKKISH